MSKSVDMGWTITGRHVAIGVVAFFGMIAAIDAVMIHLALSTFGGIETADAYRKGLDYNASISESREIEARGWSSHARYDTSRHALIIEIEDASGTSLRHLHVTGTVGRAATNKEDKTLEGALQSDGSYVASWKGASAGSWIVSTVASDKDGVIYRSKERLWIAP